MRQVQRKAGFRPPAEADGLWKALQLLERNLCHAKTEGVSPWQYAVLISTLEAAGLSASALKWLVARGYVEHGVELTLAGEQQRRFRRSRSVVFDKRCCLVLTELGAALAREMLRGVPEPTNSIAEKPTWDAVRRELRVGDVLVKRFRVPAGNQTLILEAFEEEDWPERIDDPLPPQSGRDSRNRLHEAIKSLNKNHRVALLRFHGDGTGEGIFWEMQELQS